MQRALVLLLLLGLGASPTLADDEPAKKAPPKPLTAEQAADAVVRAVKADDAPQLRALAEKDNPDPWLVADELCYRGEQDAAAEFSKAAPRVAVQRLPAYVEAWRERVPDKAERELLAAMTAALRAGEYQKVLEGTASLPSPLYTVLRVLLLRARGAAFEKRQRWRDGYEVLGGAAAAAHALGWMTQAARLYERASFDAWQGAAWQRALASLRQAQAVQIALGDEVEAARTLGNIGTVHESLGEHAKALAIYQQAHAKLLALGSRTTAAQALYGIALMHFRLGDLNRALKVYEQAYAEGKALGNRAGAAKALGGIGNVYYQLGDFARGLATYEHALAEKRAVGDGAGAAVILLSLGAAHQALGDYAKAFTIFEQAHAEHVALGDRTGAAMALNNIGNLYLDLGYGARALASFERAHAELKALKNRRGAALALANIGSAHAQLGEYAEATASTERALAEQRALGDRTGAARSLAALGVVFEAMGQHAKALAACEEAHDEQEALGTRAAAAYTLSQIGGIYDALGDAARARRALEQSARAAKRLRAARTQVFALSMLAGLHLGRDDTARALGAAKEAWDAADGLVGGLGVEQGAMARAQHARLFAIGALAAVREGDTAEVLAFLENGRAGALLDALGKREVLRWKAESLPEDLKRLDREALAAQSAARHAFDRLSARDDLGARRRAARALDAATDRVRDVAGRIQRELKQQAGLFYPRAETIEDIESALGKDQALVLYGLCLDEALALVLRQDGERVVELGKRADVETALASLVANDPGTDPAEELVALRKLIIDPLRLEKDVKTVLVSPEGALCYLPFAALFDQAVCMTPSGTTHLLLLDEEREPGEGVLALGDPDYAGASEAAQQIYYRGRTLSALPATRPEAERIGTVKLLGDKATEAGFEEAISKSKRWRAVHLACHGLIDVERPMLSSLAFTRAGEDDGFLTALEVLRMKIPADLAVLSACETGKGMVVRGEGIVGLTRAFMFAGAPRVICSLWKVDDQATQALMIKFYELWNPKEGEGLGAAAALKQAQAFVRSHDKWQHPYYWAAWVLWGLPSTEP